MHGLSGINFLNNSDSGKIAQNMQFNFNISPLANMTMPSFDFGELNPAFSIHSSQSQLQAMFIALLAQMSKYIQHVPETKNVRPYDYNRYNNNHSSDNSQKISELKPEMQEKTMQLLDYAKNTLGKEVKINSGYRTQEEQAHLRKTVPHLAAKKSAHCEGLAVDLSLIGGTDEDYAALGDYAKSIGMRWGGDFKSQKERWHFDYNWG